jgi:hypothetical protein
MMKAGRRAPSWRHEGTPSKTAPWTRSCSGGCARRLARWSARPRIDASVASPCVPGQARARGDCAACAGANPLPYPWLELRSKPADGWCVACSICRRYDPAWGELSRVFREYMASEAVQGHARRFLSCGPQDLLLPDTDFLIFCNPPEGYAQRWHRDIRWYGHGGDFSEAAQRQRWAEIQAGPGGALFSQALPLPLPNLHAVLLREGRRRRRMEKRPWLCGCVGRGAGAWARGGPRVSGHNDYMVENGGAQLRWQLALVDMPDCGVDYVPGSHRRFRTGLEEAALMSGEQQRGGGGGGSPDDAVPSAVTQ